MSRTLEPGITLLTAAEIRVVVLPIGPMPRDTFDAYIDVFSVHRHVPLNATQSFHQGGPKSPFQHLPYKTGALHFRFLQVDEARRRTRIADLHQQRQVLAVLGLLHCPLVEDLLAAHSEFERASRQWPEALAVRCCAFEPSSSHLAANTQKLNDLMIFPAGHLEQHLEVYMHEFAAAVLAALEDAVLKASVSSVKLNTYVDSGDFLGSLAQIEEGLRKLNVNDEELKEKKRWGRLQKAKGDWSLLAGSPRDAFEHYKSAMELSRTAGDAIWYGAAVEGLAHSRVLEALVTARRGPSSSSSTSQHRPDVAASVTMGVPSLQAAPAAAAVQTDMTAAGEPAVADKALLAAAAAQTLAGGSSLVRGEGASIEKTVTADDVSLVKMDTQQEQPQQQSQQQQQQQQGIFTLTSCDVGNGLLPLSAAAAPGSAGVANGVSIRAPSEVEAAAAVDMAAKDTAAAAATILTPLSQQQMYPPAKAANVAGPEVAAAAVAALAATLAADRVSLSPPSPSAAASAQAAQAATSASSSSSQSQCCSALSGPAVWAVLSRAELEGEVRELLGEARAWYKKKGGALVLQIEQQLKLCRFLAGLHGPQAARPMALDSVAMILESLAALNLVDDKLTALTEAAQLLGLVGCGRKRLLLLWAALELQRTATGGAAGSPVGSDKGLICGDAAAVLRLVLKGLEPPEQPRQQDPDDLPRMHWSMKRFLAWQQQHIAALLPSQQEQQRQQATQAATMLLTKGPSQAAGSSNSSKSTAEPNLYQQQQQWQPHFYQLLGPQLQLVAQEKGPILVSSADASSAASHTSASTLAACGASAVGAAAAAAAAAGSGAWDNVQLGMLDAVVTAAKAANAPVEAWEAAATLLRECYVLLPQAMQVSLLEVCSGCAGSMGSRAKKRPGPGPGPQVTLKRVMPGAPCLQLLHLSITDNAHKRSADGGGDSGPFIFNPYAAKRQDASAAAAAQAALPEWVCGEEGHVEVLLVNPCAAPIKLDQLQLQVQPLTQPQHHHQQQQQGPAHSRYADSDQSDVNSQAGSHVQQQQRTVSVSLAAGSKPVRVVLSYVANKPGLYAVTGVQASAWGVSWHQPLVRLPQLTPAAAAAAASREEVKPQGVFTVAVQPSLPLLKATLQCTEVQITQPSEDDLATWPSSTTNTTSSSNRLTSTAAAGLGLGPAAFPGPKSAAGAAAVAGSSQGAAALPGIDRKASSVMVFEGQTLHWTLNLNNISNEPVTGCKVTVLNAKGTVIKPLSTGANPQGSQEAAIPGQLPPSFSGAHMEVSEQGLAAGLPINPGGSLSLPVALIVGRPPGDAFDAVVLQVRITYHGSAIGLDTGNSDSGCQQQQLLGRQLVLPLRIVIQPTLKIHSIRFLQQTYPMLDGQRCKQPYSLAAHRGSATAYSSTQGPMIRRQVSHIRNSSDGAVPVADLASMLGHQPGRKPLSQLSEVQKQGHSLGHHGYDEQLAGQHHLATQQAASGAQQELQQRQHAQQSLQLATQTKGLSTSTTSSSGWLAVGSEPLLELAIRNSSERYFRAWIGCLPDSLSADSALSAVAVLEPGDMQTLHAVLPSPAHDHRTQNAASKGAAATAHQHIIGVAAAAGSGSGSSTVACDSLHVTGFLSEPSRLSCAETLVGQMVVCWEMITGAAAAGQLPRGRVQLPPVDVAAKLAPGAVAVLSPSLLQLRISARLAGTAAAAAAAAATPGAWHPAELQDLTSLLQVNSNSSAAAAMLGLAGPLWGVLATTGQWFTLQLEVMYSTFSSNNQERQQQQGPLLLQLSLYAIDLLGDGAAAVTSTPQQPGTPAAAAAAGSAATKLSGLSRQHLLQGSAADMLQGSHSSSTATGHRQLIDPGVFVAGTYDGVQVLLMPDSKVTQQLQVLPVVPGLYQFGVADMGRCGAGTPGGQLQSGPQKGRVYFNQNRLYVLVST